MKNKKIWIGLIIFTVLSVFGMTILFPIHVHGDNEASDFEILSMSNIPNRSSFLWAHFVMLYAFSLFIYYVLHKNYMEVIQK